MEWLYNAKKITKLPEEVIGFIYIIYYTDGKMYVGKKNSIGLKTLPALKSGEIRPGARRFSKRKHLEPEELRSRTTAQKGANVRFKNVPFDEVQYELKWRSYVGSSEASKDKTIKSKHILHLCTDKRSMTYLEVKELMIREVLETDAYLNNNINGNWFDNCIDGLYNGAVPEHCLFGGEYE